MRSLVRFPTLQSRARRHGLVNESECLLEGSYLEYLVEHRRPVPAWAVLNAAAHGSPDWVRIVASRNLAPAFHPADPIAAAGTVAAELLDHVGDDEVALSSVQAALLVPVELRLMVGGATASLMGVVSATRSLLSSRRV